MTTAKVAESKEQQRSTTAYLGMAGLQLIKLHRYMMTAQPLCQAKETAVT
jgi:hypothetical protein